MLSLLNLNLMNYMLVLGSFSFLGFNLLNIWSLMSVTYMFNFFWNFKFMFFIDTLSLLFVMLTLFLLSVCLLWYWYMSYNMMLYVNIIFLAMVMLVNLFLTTNVLYFFFFYEFIAVPMLIFMSLWGLKESKYLAGNLLFVYTLVGSLLLVFALSYMYFFSGSWNFFYFLALGFVKDMQMFLFIFVFLGFSMKVPIVPLHLWLPEAHVEAITPGSVLLAGMILKLSVYAYMSMLFNFMFGWYYWFDFMMILSMFGFYVPSFIALVQNDLKKIMAYSSISHMNFALIGFFEKSILGFFGSIFMLFGHAFVASALFLSVGLMYERYSSSIIYYYGGLLIFMPIWGFIFFVYILGNFGFPGTVNFVGEFFMFFAGMSYSFLFFFFSFLGMLLTLMYSLFLYVRLAKGFILVDFLSYFSDLTRREFFICFIFLIFIIFLGMYPFYFLNFVFFMVVNLI